MRRFACLLLILSANVSSAQDESWVGKTIVTKQHDVGISSVNKRGKEEYVGKLNDSVSYRVKAEKGNRIQVLTTDGKEGWFDKTDAVLAEDAIAHFSAVLKTNPDNAGAYQKRAFAKAREGHLDGAIRDVNEVIRLSYYDMAGWNNRGNLHLAKKEYDAAIRDFSLAVRLNANAAVHCNRGLALVGNKNYAKAIADFDLAIAMEPKMAYAYNNRGLALFLSKEYESALRDFAKAEILDPDNAALYKNLAWMMATCVDAKYRDGAKAVELAIKALKLADNPDGDFHQTLAAAHAEAANFEEAVLVLERMQKEARWTDDPSVRQQLELHRQKKAVRQE